MLVFTLTAKFETDVLFFVFISELNYFWKLMENTFFLTFLKIVVASIRLKR